MSREKPNWGSAIVDGNIRYTSVSAVQVFDPLTYGGCPRRYFFKYKEKRSEPTTKAQSVGAEMHEQIEHWLTTDPPEDVLGPIARAGQHLIPRPGKDLIVEQGFGDAAKAIALREARLKSSPTASWDALLDSEVDKVAGLSVAGIPLVGFIDIRHSRGEFIDSDGVLKKERAEYGRVIELIDHKSRSNLDYCSTSEDLAESVQMLGYANIREVRENADFVRLSHLNFQTRGAKVAKKVTTIISVEQARKGWERVHGLGREMIGVARASRPEEVDTQIESCGAFHVGCPHTSYCDRPQRTITDLLQIKVPERGEPKMGTGFFESLKDPETSNAAPQNGVATASTGLFGPSVPPIPSLPPVAGAERQAVIDAEKTRLLAADNSYGVCGVCQVLLNASNASRLPDGTVKHIGCLSTFLTAPIPAIQSIGAINPPDAPPFNPLAAAEPLSEEAIAMISDPELRVRATAHAAAVKAAAPPPLPGKEKTSGRCAGGGQRFKLTTDEVATKKKLCPVCGKEIKLKIAKEGDDYMATLGGHLMKAAEPPVPIPTIPIPAIPSVASTVPVSTVPALPSLPVPAAPPLPAPPPLPGAVSHLDKAKSILAEFPWNDDLRASHQALVAIAHVLVAIAEGGKTV